MSTVPQKGVRGIRSPNPSGHLVGRLDAGDGEAIFIPIEKIAAVIAQIFNTGSGQGQGGGYGGPNDPTIDVQGFLDQLGVVRGSLIFRAADGWTVLLPGTAGFILETGGPGADPAWTAGGALPATTDDLPEGAVNLYFTAERVDDQVAILIQNGTGISWVYSDVGGTLTPTVSLSAFTTTNLAEGSNLYFTNERVDDRVAALIQNGTGITWTYDDTANTLTGNVSITQYTDEMAQDAVGTILVNSARVTLTYSDSTPSITADLVLDSVSVAYMHASTASVLFGRTTAGAGAGEELVVGASLLLTGGSIRRAALTGDITAAANSNATTLATVNANVGSFGSTTQVMTQTVNAKGLTTAAANVTIAIPSTQITDFNEAAQDAIGAMVDGTLVYVDATPLLTRAALTGDITAPQASNVTTLATVNANVGSFGLAASVPQFTVNAKGLVTAAANVAIAIVSTQVTDFAEATDDRVAVLIQNGTGISWTYSDAGGTLTPAVTLAPFSTTNLAEGSNLYFTNERVDDRVAALIINSATVTWTYDDTANTLSAAAVSDPASILARTFIGY